MDKDNEMIKQLQELPELINKKLLFLFSEGQQKDELELNMRMIEDNLKAAIDEEMIDGKKKYPNELQRKLELEKRLKQNDTHTIYRKTLLSVEPEMKRAAIELEYLRNKFSSMKAIARLMND